MFKGFAVMVVGSTLAFVFANMGPSYEGLGWFVGYASILGGPYLMWKDAYGDQDKD